MKKILWCLLTLVMFCNVGFSQNLDVIEKELQEVLNQKNDELVSVSIVLKSQINSAKLHSRAEEHLDKSARREFVIDELKEFSLKTQADVLSYLQAEEKSGKVSGISSLWIVNAISCDASKDVIYKLSSHPDVEVIGYNKEVQLISSEQMKEIKSESASNVRAGGPDTHVQDVEADSVWETGYTGKNIVVAVLDSGTNTNHLDLKDHLWKGFIDTDGDEIPDAYVNGWNFIDNNSNITDDFGHGTHCAGLVCGDGTSIVTTGIAPDASLMTVKTINRSGGGSVAQMINGVQFAVENGADIISMSLGFKNNQITTAQKEEIRFAFDNVLEAGVIVCAAAGNDGNTYGAPNNVDYPAACPAPWTNPDQTLKGGNSSVICVGAHDLDESSRGPSTWEGTSYNDYPYNEGASMGLIRPDISAPGYFIRSTKYNQNDIYEIRSGTSQATPIVAGVIALMLEKNSTLTPAQISQIIEETATSKPATKNNIVGAGVVNALAAVNSITETVGNPFIKINAFAPKSMATGIQTISFSFKNEGAGASDENTSVTLSLSNDPYVTIINPTQTLGKLGVNNSKTLFFDLDIDSQTPSGHTITFNIATTSGTFNWEETCSVMVSLTPNLAFQSVSPGLVSTNATSDIKVTMVNNGTADFTGPITLKLVTTSYDLKYVTLINDETTIPALGVGETGTGTFTIKTKEPIYPYDFFLETYSESTVGRNYVYEFENDLEGWTGIKGSYCHIAPWLHSTEAGTYTEVGESNSGNGHLKSISYINGTAQQPNSIDNYLVSPVKIKVSEDTKVSFYARANNDYYYKEHFGFAVSTAGNTSVSDFTTIQEWVITNRTTWTKYTVDLSEYYGQEIYVAIRHFFPNDEWENSDNGYYLDALDIDDIIFENVLINTQHSSTLSYDDPYYFNVTASSNPNLPMVGAITATPMSGAMSLEWDAVDGVSEYGVYRDGHRVATVTGTAYVDENLSYNKQYCYAVTTITSYESGLSEEVCATTLEVDKISVPTNLVATTTSESTIDLTWDNVKEAESYKVYQGTNLIASGITDTKYTVENLDAETNYCFVVTAVNIVGESEDSESACATTLKAKPAPPVVTATADSESAITLTWEAVYGAESYKVYQEENVIASTKNTTYTISGLEAETNYCFTVTAVNETGESVSSESACATTLEAPKAPEAPVVTATADGENAVILTWNAVENATSYNIYPYPQGTDVIALGIAETTYTVSGLNPETEYCFVVTAVNEIGESENSEPACATTDEKITGIIVKSYDLSNHIGETTLTATLINKCETAIPAGAKVNLSCNDSYVTIVDGTYDLLNDLAIDGTTTATFTIEIAESVPVNYDIEFNISVQYEGYSQNTKNLNYTFNNDLDGCTTISGDGHNWYHSSNQSAHGYNKTYNTTPSGMGFIFSESYCNKGSGFNPDHWIVLPEQIIPSDWTTIEFYACSMANQTTFAGETFGVFVSTTSNTDSTTFKKVGSGWTLAKNSNSLKMALKSEMLIDYEDQKIWVAIRHYGAGDNAALAIDDIVVSNVKSISTVTYEKTFTVTVNTSVNIYTGIGSWTNIANWSKGVVPISTDDVVINGDVTIENGDITVKSLTINNEKLLTVNEGVKLTVSGKFVSPSASSLIINDGAQICQTSENVPATFMMKIENPEVWSEANKTGWQFISSPLKNSEFESFIPETDDYDLYLFDGSKEKEWVNYKSSAASFGTDFEQGRAYMVSYETEEMAVFTGYLNHERTFTFDVPYQYEGGEFKDFFLLGNPFTFDISWSDIEFSGMIEDYAYVKKDGNYGYSTPTSTIKVGDGFFVKTLSNIGTEMPYVKIDMNAKRKKESVKFINLLAKGKEGTDNVVINFAGNEKEGFPKLENFNDKIANVYVAENDSRYGIYSYDANVTEIPVCFEAKQMGSYSISMEAEGEFENIVLIDKFTGEEINMLLDSEYKFTATNNDNFNRFIIKIVNRIEKNDIFAHQNGEELIIDAEGTIQIIDVMGRTLYNNDVESGNNRINVSDLRGSTYILRNISDNGVRIQKIVIL
ncbi:MAG: S8 family serine peptidase [Bacteroidales bacterium]|nr:S8 family serine peptidase [Bacteroidales bacterium]